MDLKTLASETETIVEQAMRLEPVVMTAASFLPGAAPIVAIVHPAVAMAAPFIEKALTLIAAGNNGDAFGALVELLQHVTPGQGNSAILSGPTPALTP